MAQVMTSTPGLNSIELNEIADGHPISIMANHYLNTNQNIPTEGLPVLETLLARSDPELMTYGLLLEPTSVDPFLDFIVLQKGVNIPGIKTTSIEPGELYSQRLDPGLANERVMELATSLVLKKPMYARASSARKSTLNMKVLRGVFPIWQEKRRKSGVILMISPVYTQIKSA